MSQLRERNVGYDNRQEGWDLADKELTKLIAVVLHFTLQSAKFDQ